MIEKYDKNFAAMPNLPDVTFYDTKQDARFSVYGLPGFHRDGTFTRIPHSIVCGMREAIQLFHTHTAGGRIRFVTDSPKLVFRCVSPDSSFAHATRILTNGFDVYEGNEYLCSVMPPVGYKDEYEATCLLGEARMRELTVNLPLYGSVEALYIGVKRGSTLCAAKPYLRKKPVLYYGSSITQGGCASRPGTCYQAYISRYFDTDYLNLGFSGNALAEPEMIEFLSTIDASVFVCDYDHNAPDPEHLKNTHEKLYLTYRAAHKDTPVVFLSKPDCFQAEDNERRKIVYATYLAAKKRGENVSFIDGRKLLGVKDRKECTVDGCHPNDLGFYRMAQKLIATLKPLLK